MVTTWCDSRIKIGISVKPETIFKSAFIAAAFLSFIASVTIYFTADDGDVFGRLNGIYVGVWVPSILALGAFLMGAQSNKRS
jgi:hypothetical protein